jgi:hypothetical protein
MAGMKRSSGQPVTNHRFRILLNGDGQPGPIEERVGRRLLRLIDPASEEGKLLIASAPMEWVGPDGTSLGRISARDAYTALVRRLERRLESAPDDGERRELRHGLDRVRTWSRTLADS